MISDKAKAAILDKCCQKVDCLARGEVIDLEGALDASQSSSAVTALDEIDNIAGVIDHVGFELCEKLANDIREQTARLRTFVFAQRPDQWQPIGDFVPGNDNPNVLVVDQGVVSEAYYDGETDNWFKAGKSEHDFDFVNGDRLYPTHWQPMLAPPQGPDTSTDREGK